MASFTAALIKTSMPDWKYALWQSIAFNLLEIFSLWYSFRKVMVRLRDARSNARANAVEQGGQLSRKACERTNSMADVLQNSQENRAHDAQPLIQLSTMPTHSKVGPEDDGMADDLDEQVKKTEMQLGLLLVNYLSSMLSEVVVS